MQHSPLGSVFEVFLVVRGLYCDGFIHSKLRLKDIERLSGEASWCSESLRAQYLGFGGHCFIM